LKEPVTCSFSKEKKKKKRNDTEVLEVLDSLVCLIHVLVCWLGRERSGLFCCKGSVFISKVSDKTKLNLTKAMTNYFVRIV
jgi:hypothetical protein